MQKKILIKVILFLFLTNSSFSQELRQFSIIPQNYNSAFAGINKCKNINFSNRIHLLSIGQFFYSNSLIADGYFNKLSGALLLKISNSSAPDNVFNSQSISFAYSYHLKLSKKYMMSLSLGTQYLSENFNNNNLIFPDMLSVWSSTVSQSAEFVPAYRNKTINFNAGAIFWTQNYYLSTSVNNFLPLNLNQDKINNVLITILGERKNIGIYNNVLMSINSAVFMSNYFIDVSNGLTLSVLKFNFGAFTKQNLTRGYLSNGVLCLIGFNFNRLNIAYSYDFYYSGVNISQSSNSEITIKYILKCNEKDINNTINCPAY